MSEIELLMNQQKDFFNTNTTKSLSFRRKQLKALKTAILKYEDAIYDALWRDLHKAKFEVYETEIGIVLAEITYMLKNLEHLAKPQVHKPALTLFPAKSFTIKEPFGVVLIISPWNYPFQLALTPLVGA
ncbi:MAG TPA: aldehyde dehydrogenase family protein, partial [Candidatus Dorea intestinavium]|nr:aldehyde dehydrogenase family protein [Candidatus Dorea intestinavium]